MTFKKIQQHTNILSVAHFSALPINSLLAKRKLNPAMAYAQLRRISYSQFWFILTPYKSSCILILASESSSQGIQPTAHRVQSEAHGKIMVMCEATEKMSEKQQYDVSGHTSWNDHIQGLNRRSFSMIGDKEHQEQSGIVAKRENNSKKARFTNIQLGGKVEEDDDHYAEVSLRPSLHSGVLG